MLVARRLFLVATTSVENVAKWTGLSAGAVTGIGVVGLFTAPASVPMVGMMWAAGIAAPSLAMWYSLDGVNDRMRFALRQEAEAARERRLAALATKHKLSLRFDRDELEKLERRLS